jgi:hypothetical protein
MHGEGENYVQSFGWKPERKEHLLDLGINGRTTLK